MTAWSNKLMQAGVHKITFRPNGDEIVYDVHRGARVLKTSDGQVINLLANHDDATA